jgi:hypothetical protein
VIVAPIYVPLEIEIEVKVKDTYVRSQVKDSLLKVFSSRQWPDGQRGIFYPGHYTFGKTVYDSDLSKPAYEVAGVDTVTVTTFQRQGITGSSGRKAHDDALYMDWMEIARMENDPDFPERGMLSLIMSGGI